MSRFFPKIFGKNEDLPLDFEGSWAAFKKLTEEVIYFDYFFPFFCLFVVVVVVHVVLFALYLPSLIPVIKLLLLLPSLQKGGWRSGHQDKAFVPSYI